MGLSSRTDVPQIVCNQPPGAPLDKLYKDLQRSIAKTKKYLKQRYEVQKIRWLGSSAEESKSMKLISDQPVYLDILFHCPAAHTPITHGLVGAGYHGLD